jgi:hypothetical protein
MPRKHDDIWSGRVWALAAAVTFTASCPGYLEERAWLADGGSLPGVPTFDTGVPPTPVASGGTGGSAVAATGGSTGTGGAATATGGTGGTVTPPPGTGGSGGAGPVDSGARNDAVIRGGDGGGSPEVNAALPCSAPAEVSRNILVPKCGFCHGANMPAQALDLVTAGAKARILNKPSVACNSKPLATATGEGHFFDKLIGAVPGCGGQMPFGGIAILNAEQIQCLRDWVKNP